jgi:tRNA (cytidine/uridine-2'-O-)-methyltransferase
MINIVLYQPEIPPNTGNIARLCVCNDFSLHIIHPIGFSLANKELKRAGLDYWERLNLYEHNSWDDFYSGLSGESRKNLYFFSSRGSRKYWEIQYSGTPYLVFGSETNGLPVEFHEKFKQQFVTIPMFGKNDRCLNVSNSVAIAAYEVLRQFRNP